VFNGEINKGMLDELIADKTLSHAIGHCRGGIHSCGGILWCDFNKEFEPVDGLRQVFGHTAGKNIRQKGENMCVDCNEFSDEVLELEV
jgi:hypothetical protein